MKKFIIERDMPGAGDLSPSDLEAVSQKSCGVLATMGHDIQWVESYVTGDKIYCVYVASDEARVREHGRRGEFPVTHVGQVTSVIGPETAGPDYVPPSS